MKYFGIAGLLYVGIQIGIFVVVGIIAAIFTPGILSNVYINNYTTLVALPFLVLSTAGYIYAVKRNRKRMRQVVLNLFVVFAIHQVGSLAWPYVEPLLDQARN